MAPMKISLTPETVQRIRNAIGDDVDLAPDLVPNVLARLAVEAPVIYSQVLEELSGSQIRLDSEQELRRRQRRGLFRRLLFWWGEYDTEVGDRLLNRRHIAAAVPLALAVLTLTLLAIALVVGRRVPPAPAQPIAVQRSPREVIRPETRIPPVAVPRPNLMDRDEMNAATRRPRGDSSGRSAFAGVLPVPALPPGLAGFPDSPAASGRGPGNPVVVNIQAHEPATRTEPGAGVVSPVVYNRLADADSVQQATLDHPIPPAASKTTGSAPGTGNPGGVARTFAQGMRLQATLLTGAVVVPGGPPVPVVVETTEPHGTWLGQATLGPAERVQITFVLTNHDRAEGVRGIALDPERLLPGIQGQTTIRRSGAAAAMATATLQAAADYAQAAARQGSINVLGGGGFVALGGQVPEAWTYLAARLAQEFQARGAAGGWVMTTEIPAGTPLMILVTGAS